MTISKMVANAIRNSIGASPEWDVWAKDWLAGKNRTSVSAAKAAADTLQGDITTAATKAAMYAARAAEWLAHIAAGAARASRDLGMDPSSSLAEVWGATGPIIVPGSSKSHWKAVEAFLQLRGSLNQ